MLYSMTGFNRYTKNLDFYTATWEIRSVNSKYLDVKWHLPQYMRGFEIDFEKILRAYAKRGKVDIYLEIQYHTSEQAEQRVFLDKVQANQMIKELSVLAKEHHILFQPDFNNFFNISFLWTSKISENNVLIHNLIDSLKESLEEWNKSRHIEGKALKEDLLTRITNMTTWVEKIEVHSPVLKEEKLAQLKERLKNLLESMDSELQEQRFLQECVILADKTDVSEEIIRLKAHLKRISELLASGTDAGRKIDFTLQEAFREINTLGNKIQDKEISPVIVDFKTELEKCREQSQNLE